MIDFVRRGYASAFSRGFGYEPHPIGSRARFDSVAGYFIDYRAKIASRQANPGRITEPTDLAQLALGWWEAVLLGEPGAPEEFERICILIRTEGEDDAGATLWPFRAEVPKWGLPNPWYSAMAQGQMASVLIRAQSFLGGTYGDLALRALEPLVGPNQYGLVARTADGLVLEEAAPSRPPSHILNGWIFALWGLWDAATALDDARARRLYEDSLECLVRKIPQYDVGWWTKYSLFPHPMADLAKPFYHRLHVTQVSILGRMTGASELSRAAERWRGYDRRPAAAAAVLSKIPFIISNGLARRRERYATSASRSRIEE
jgi:heparosan-N-sulfate-glucuronate 5-epimerase